MEYCKRDGESISTGEGLRPGTLGHLLDRTTQPIAMLSCDGDGLRESLLEDGAGWMQHGKQKRERSLDLLGTWGSMPGFGMRGSARATTRATVRLLYDGEIPGGEDY
jgi:hypothetical protein